MNVVRVLYGQTDLFGSPCKIWGGLKINGFRAIKVLQIVSWYNEFTQFQSTIA